MRDYQNSAYRQALPRVRQLLAEQQERRDWLAIIPAAERSRYFYQSSENAAKLLAPEPRPIYLDDLLFTVQYISSCIGEFLSLETMCEMLFDNAEFFIQSGSYTTEDLDSIYVAYQGRLN